MENQTKPLFTALSSELLSPVSMIKQNLESLKKHCKHSDASFSEEIFSFAENSIENILGFIDNFNFLNTSDEINMNLKPQWFSFQDLIAQIREELKQLNLDTSRIKVTELPHQLNVHLDRYLVSRILFNLLGNALKFSGKKVELNISIARNKLTMTVRDYGIGIPSHQITEIFNPFVRGENARRIPGTGIGLSIVARAVDCLDGAVSVVSEPEKFTEFQVILPYQLIRKTNPMARNKNTQNINPV